jgi:putative tryptophan/tyrosine transport system substrate-binding protein
VKRRKFITLLGGAAAAWPIAARGQQPAMPVVGFLYTGGPTDGEAAPFVGAFRQGLGEVGFVEGHNVAVEYRWPGFQREQLAPVVAELVQRQIAVIVGNTPPAMAAKSATSTIPIVFVTGTDPVALGLVASFNRPGGNATGVSFLSVALEAKRLGMLRELLPQATVLSVFVDPNSPDSAIQLRDVEEAARTLGLQVRILRASTESELENGFATLAQQRCDGLLVAPAAFFTAQRKQIVELAARHSLPTVYGWRDFPMAGGLMSYGSSLVGSFRQAGTYTGRILKGEKPADLPVLQPTKFELIINTKTAKSLGLNIPDRLLALADEVIE